MNWSGSSKRTHSPTDQEVLECANAGMSMTQAYRYLKLGGSCWLFRYLKQPDKEELHKQFIQNGKKRQSTASSICKDDEEIVWPPAYRPLPAGYKVKWIESCEHYIGINEEMNIESPIFCNRFQARRWCIAHDEKQKEKQNVQPS